MKKIRAVVSVPTLYPDFLLIFGCTDEWHESSDYDDVMNYHDEEEQFDWR